MSRLRTICAFLTPAAAAGCIAPTANPSFDVGYERAVEAIDAMQEDPRPLDRPVVILGGWFDPGIAATRIRIEMEGITDPEQVGNVSFAFLRSFDGCRRRLIDYVERRFPGDDPEWTTEVDVIAVSMGGLIARYAEAVPAEGRRRLRIARLFTISTPHRGARSATMLTLDPLVRDMRPGSAFIETLDARERVYEIYPYGRLEDWVVGVENSAPPGEVCWWVPNVPFQRAHASAYRDARILADIMRRLRNEPPLTTIPRRPLPPPPSS